jgi:hypothetical protein
VTNGVTMWKALQSHAPKHRWIPLAEVFALVENHMSLDAEDLSHTDARSGNPRWKTNVRRLLRTKVKGGTIRARRGEGSNHRGSGR